MLADEANMQKQKKREEQLKRWREREMSESGGGVGVGSGGGGGGATTIESYEKAQKMLKKESKVKFPKGCVFLAACSSGDTDEVRQHLRMGVNINTTNIDGLTALHQACIDANLDMVKFLVDNGADINAQDNEGWTPLHAAVSVGNLEVAKFLINKGARLNVCNNDSDLPIDLCDAGNTQMKEYLDDEMKRQSIDADFEKRKEEMIMYEDAKEMNFLDKIHQKTGATALHVSAAKGYLRVIKLLLQCGANVNEVDKDGWTPLHAAAHWEQEEACKILAENGADFDIKSYSGQTPYDVCDKEMGAKLRMLQNKQQQQQQTGLTNNQKDAKLNDSTTNSSVKLESYRIRKSSDELNKSSSITRLTNEAKSSISEREKKQDKILLSPISNSTKPQFDMFTNSDSETDRANKNLENDETGDTRELLNNHDDRFTFDKENIDRSNYTNSASNASQGSSSSNIGGGLLSGEQSDQLQTTKPLNKSNSLNKTKTGLQENLKSLSAQVKLKMDEDKDEINDKQISFKTNGIDNSNISSSNVNNNLTWNDSTAKTGTAATTANGSTPPAVLTSASASTLSPTNTSSSSILNSSTTSFNNLNGTRPYLERRWGNAPGQTETSTYRRRIGLPNSNLAQSPIGSPVSNDSQTSLSPNSLNNQSDLARRYSSAPIASKDEQAELIRKQKAKLERHFRRSTQAVSYEDIKSAEATIKGGSLNSPNPALNETGSTSDSPSLNGPIVPSSTSSTTTFNFNQPPPPQVLATVAINSPTISQQGVSTLSSLFGETISKNASSSNLYGLAAAQSPSSPTSSTTNTSGSNQQASSNSLSIPSAPTAAITSNNNNTSSSSSSASTSTNATNPSESSEKDTIIANDIETDKLLTVIEKSKGFSDTNSTTATRRLRNRAIPFGPVQSTFNSSYNDRFSSKTQSSSEEAQSGEEKPESIRQMSSPQRNSALSSNESNNQALTIDVSQQNNSSSSTSNLGQSQSRPMFRFGQNENAPTANGLQQQQQQQQQQTAAAMSTNAVNNSRSAIKRSVSQVPSTDRRNQAAGTTANANTNGTSSNHTSNNNNASEFASSFDSKNIDFQAAYELMKKENEQLNQTILKLQKDLEEQNKKLQNIDTIGLDKREKRAFDRRISELEEEVKKVENLKQDNNRLKEENAALIRVISKLSK